MSEFWESSFKEKQIMWGHDAADSTFQALDLFRKNGIKKILIPGFGYGRNAKVFYDKGFDVTGIEISETAIALAREQLGDEMKIYHGSVADMPFDNESYGGIFSYALIHLLNSRERAKLIRDCYNQLDVNGYMVFVAVSKGFPSYGTGRMISKDRFETMPGVKIFFYDEDSIKREFQKYGLVQYIEIEESGKLKKDKPTLKFWYIVCQKK